MHIGSLLVSSTHTVLTRFLTIVLGHGHGPLVLSGANSIWIHPRILFPFDPLIYLSVVDRNNSSQFFVVENLVYDGFHNNLSYNCNENYQVARLHLYSKAFKSILYAVYMEEQTLKRGFFEKIKNELE